LLVTDALLGQELPRIVVAPPGPSSRTFLVRHARAAAPMGPRRTRPPHGIVYASALGANVTDVDGNRYVDLAAGFGAQLVGHRHPSVQRALVLESERLHQALGDVYPSDAKVSLVERLSRLHPDPEARVIVGQSGSDAVTAALKTAALATGRPGVLAFTGAYHGLGYAPLAACGLRSSYREPFSGQLNPSVRFVDYPASPEAAMATLSAAREALEHEAIGAVLVEPILGRGGVVVPPEGFLTSLAELARRHGALLVVDEIWTGLGRSGAMLYSLATGVTPDLVCLGKGLGGALPVSAAIGRGEVMQAWSREDEVVHTSTYAGAPLAAATALATLDVLEREALVARSRELGERFRRELANALAFAPDIAVRGEGLMLGVDFGRRSGGARAVLQKLLAQGYLATTGGGGRDVLVLTPPLTIAEALLDAATGAIADAVRTTS
jgi:4-aminobutyrate aminotransferase/(S)-3-amino-2-methylpropionate transaminase